MPKTKKFNLSQLMNEQSKAEGGKSEATSFKIEQIPIGEIIPWELNKYSVDDIAELKASIELFGLQQNLVVMRRKDQGGKYQIISGHRRFKALTELNAEGKGFSFVPCKVELDIKDVKAELQLILANSTTRRLTDYELTYQAARIKELLTELRDGGYKITGRTREIVAEMLKVSPSQIGRMESIDKNLSPELKEEFQKENINITTAYELSRLDAEKQALAHADFKGGMELNPENAKERREKPPKSKPATEPEPPITDIPQNAPPEVKNELKNCPLCGKRPRWGNGHNSIHCDDCTLRIIGLSSVDTKTKWNRRA